MILIKDVGCDELLRLNMFIFYGTGAVSKGIPISKQQHKKVKVKQSRYRPKMAQRVPGI
jgi:hypothetical protein